ncbi:MAG: helix-turn-helix domain-containing protein [Burkholderiaceae bacterium]
MKWVALDLGLSESTVRSLIRKGELEAVFLGPRSLVVSVESVARFIDRRKAARRAHAGRHPLLGLPADPTSH